MANFYIRAGINVIPIEEITFTDTSQKARGVHSQIDSISASSYEKLIGAVAGDIVKKTYNPPNNTGESLDTILSTQPSYVNFLYIALKTRGTETEGLGPRLVINYPSDTSFQVSFGAVGQFICLPAISGASTDSILLYGGTGYLNNSFEILVALTEI